jgi:hypothetical protein
MGYKLNPVNNHATGDIIKLVDKSALGIISYSVSTPILGLHNGTD